MNLHKSKNIKKVNGYEVLDSRGNPTVCARVELYDGSVGYATVPSGASVGAYEAFEKRDGDKSRFGGKGVLGAVRNIEEKISDALEGMAADDQELIDYKMIALDGSENKQNYGANAILAVSVAAGRAAADHYRMEFYRYIGGMLGAKLPIPMMNVINGGAHAKNNVDIQEFMLVPTGGDSFAVRVQMCAEVYHALGRILKNEGYSVSVGDEGGYTPDLEEDREAISFIVRAIETCGYSGKIKIALDVASSEWFENGVYRLPKRGTLMSRDELCKYYGSICHEFPIISIEDGMAEDDIGGWRKLTEQLGERVMLVGDDLFVTNTSRIKMGVQNKIANSVLLKPNQIGTLSETASAFAAARENGYKTVFSHRSGDSEDAFLADISVGLGGDFIKSGAPCRSERVAKYNRLMLIENQLLWHR